MPYQEHPHCIPPEGGDPDKIWRYMSLTKFIAILENKELFFPRADNFEDPFEGSLPEPQHERREEYREEYPAEWVEELLPRFRRICTRHTFLSCWHMNEGESAAMWDLYLKSDEGICIQSTFDRFIESIASDSQDIYISKINYVDYEEQEFSGWTVRGDMGDTLSPFIYKRESFKHEKELRAIIHDLPWYSENGATISAEDIRKADLSEEVYEPGRGVDIDLERLIESIRISPDSPSWVKRLVEDICERYALGRELVEESPITNSPHY